MKIFFRENVPICKQVYLSGSNQALSQIVQALTEY